jgi:hypothetical protein
MDIIFKALVILILLGIYLRLGTMKSIMIEDDIDDKS